METRRRIVRSTLLGVTLFGVTVLGVAIGAGSAEKTPRTFELRPVGTYRVSEKETAVLIDAPYRDALLGLDGFSHVWVIWWFDRNDTPERRSVLRVHPRGNRDHPLTGVFATRSPARPNLIAMTLSRIRSVEKDRVVLERTDAFDGTPVLDLKPYIPGYDGTGEAEVPEWVGAARAARGR